MTGEYEGEFEEAWDEVVEEFDEKGLIAPNYEYCDRCGTEYPTDNAPDNCFNCNAPV